MKHKYVHLKTHWASHTIHQNIAVNLWQFTYGKNSFMVLIPDWSCFHQFDPEKLSDAATAAAEVASSNRMNHTSWNKQKHPRHQKNNVKKQAKNSLTQYVSWYESLGRCTLDLKCLIKHNDVFERKVVNDHCIQWLRLWVRIRKMPTFVFGLSKFTQINIITISRKNVLKLQCDQMAWYFFNIWPFATVPHGKK